MFYKPKFCAECGEKVERSEWQPWTSRRFCDDCASQFESSIRWKTGIAAVSLLLVGVFAGQIRFTATKQITVTDAQALVASSPKAALSNTTAKNVAQSSPAATNTVVQSSPSGTNQITTAPPVITTQNEMAYYCGAKTQKGNICTRRVRGGGRCWQHVGKPAMLPQAKLLIQPGDR